LHFVLPELSRITYLNLHIALRGRTRCEISAIQQFDFWGKGMSATTDMASDRWLNTKQAAAHLGCSSQWLEKRRCKKMEPEFCKQGDRVFYSQVTLDAWIRKGVVKPTPGEGA
jgi:hypothetical protein